MSNDEMTTLRAAKPVQGTSHLLDPAVLERVRSTALGGTHSGIAPGRRRRPGLAPSRIGIAAAVVAASATALILLPGGSVAPSEALAQAVQRTADFASGRIIWTYGGNTNDVRYDQHKVASDSRSTPVDDRDASGQPVVRQTFARVIDGTLYVSLDGTTFRTQPIGGAEPDGDRTLLEQARAIDALADAVKTAGDVSSQTADGITTYTATIDTSKTPIPYGLTIVASAPNSTDATSPQTDRKPVELHLSGMSGTPGLRLGPVKLRIRVQDGIVRRFTAENDSGDSTSVRAEISDLGQPQQITAPTGDQVVGPIVPILRRSGHADQFTTP